MKLVQLILCSLDINSKALNKAICLNLIKIKYGEKNKTCQSTYNKDLQVTYTITAFINYSSMLEV